MRNPWKCRFVLLIILSVVTSFWRNAAENTASPDEQKRAALLKEVQVPDGFEATIFAIPPAVNYPVFVAAAPDGTVYVSSDKNGSLDRAPHRGRVLRVRDLDGDGHADEVKQFVPDVDSPRGLVWDRDRLYLLHPPHLSAFIDKDGDGTADEEKILVKNIAFTFKDRPADHSSNGIELGIDGWIYCAIGDFGFMRAEGTDGRTLQLRGGGVVRVRPDGTGLELYSRGTRNILEAAVSPRLDIFARDNTNDGDGWDIRFHHFTGLSEHGYPSLFKHFPGEFIEPLADYGGGSGCGAMFLSEPGFPAGYNNAVYSCDWGREWVYRHIPTAKGGTFTVDQTQFVRAPRVTDVDVDALGHIYVASWKGASFTYVGEEVGFLARVTPKGYKAEIVSDFSKLEEKALLQQLESESHRRRLAAQRELLAREIKDNVVAQLKTLAKNKTKSIETRIAALFALKQGLGERENKFFAELASDESMREYAIRALCDRLEETRSIPQRVILAGLKDQNPRVRWEASFAVVRLGDPKNAAALTPLLGDADPIVAHTAMQSLKQLKGINPCFEVLDNPRAASAQVAGALRVLQLLHEPEVVEGLISRLKTQNDPGKKRGILTALCRLHYTDGEWKGDSWGTRPDTSGPYYQPVEWTESSKIATVLTDALRNSKGDDAAFLAAELARHKIQSPEMIATAVDMAADNPLLIPALVAQLARADEPPAKAIDLLTRAAVADSSDDIVRANSVIALSKCDGESASEAMLQALPRIKKSKSSARELSMAQQAFLRTKKTEQQYAFYDREAKKLNGAKSEWADAALLQISRNGSAEARNAAKRSLDDGWTETGRRAQILHAIALSENRAAREKVLNAVNDSDPKVSEAAMVAVKALRLEKEIKRQKTETTVEKLSIPEAINFALKEKGNTKLGEELFTKQGCVNCHTVAADQPLKGPFLGNIATIYKRDELAAAVLVPSKTIAQGFATHHFELKDGSEMDGFVIQEAAEKVTIRNVAAQEIEIATKDIAKRSKLETSLMPEGLAANLTVNEFASLLDYLQSLSKK